MPSVSRRESNPKGLSAEIIFDLAGRRRTDIQYHDARSVRGSNGFPFSAPKRIIAACFVDRRSTVGTIQYPTAIGKTQTAYQILCNNHNQRSYLK